jgi:predicted acylesterase/phospholipase RssA
VNVDKADAIFVGWEEQEPVDGEMPPCPLSVDDLVAVEKSYRIDPKSAKFRRRVLSEARRTLEGDTVNLAGDPARLAQYNDLRELIADIHYHDVECPIRERLDAALDALLSAREHDDLTRPRTLHLAGDLYRERGRQRMRSDDTRLAVLCYVAAWERGGFPSWKASAFEAAGLLTDLGQTNDEQARQYTTQIVDQRFAAKLEPVVDLAKRLRLEAKSYCAQSQELYAEIIRTAHDHALTAARGILAHVGPQESRQRLDQTSALGVWDAVFSLSDRLSVEDREQRRGSVQQPLRELWESALALLRAHVAREEWTETTAWADRISVVASTAGNGLYVDGGHLPGELSAMVQQTLSLITRPVLQQGLEALAVLMKEGIRGRLLWFHQGRTETDGFESSAPLGFEPAELSRLVKGVVDAHRRGRIGVALSGGGFRASFFHPGMLARLADLDLLRHVEVISGVSGGAIIAACYHLKVKALLEARHDATLSAADYRKMIASLTDEFLEGVQRNIRTRIFADPRSVLKLWLHPSYGPTERLAELLASELFSRVTDDCDAISAPLGELRIRPFGEPSEFNPSTDNWGRSTKVPTLVINATTLNTGHNWLFCDTTAGEPVFAIDPDIDATDRLREFPLRGGPDTAKQITLSTAVAASACVPGAFPPLQLGEVFQSSLHLVDGGVFDNQGISALLDRECEIVLVSDGSQQIAFEPAPARSPARALSRTNAILMERVRQLQFRALVELREVGSLRDLVFVHLTRGLPRRARLWSMQHADERSERFKKSSRNLTEIKQMQTGTAETPKTPHGINEPAQQLLAGIRTDLDSFHQKEAYSLFCSGYAMTTRDLSRGHKSLLLTDDSVAAVGGWRPLQVWADLTADWPSTTALEQHLRTSRHRFFKPAALLQAKLGFQFARQGRKYRNVAVFFGLAMVGLVLWALIAAPVTAYVVAGTIATWSAAWVLAALAGALIAVAIGPLPRHGFLRATRERFLKLVAGPLLAVVMIASWIQLKWLDPWYLSKGAVDTKDGRPGGTHIHLKAEVIGGGTSGAH